VVGKLLHIPVPGVRLDKVMIVAIPVEVAKQLDLDLMALVEAPWLDEDETGTSDGSEGDERQPFYVGGTIPKEETTSDDALRVRRRPFYVGGKVPRDRSSSDDDDELTPHVRPSVPLSPPEPFLFTQNILQEMWEGALNSQDNGKGPSVHRRAVPVGPYELAVQPTGRGRSSVRAVLQGMYQGKQIEIFTPSELGKDSGSKTVIAIWIYEDTSMAVVYLDLLFRERCILWHAPDAHHFNIDYVEQLRQRLSTLNLEVPDRLDRTISKK
jgi:hypothetical protein